MSTRTYSDAQEQYIAKHFNGRVTSNSGGTKFGGGDVLTKSFLIEAKTTETPKKSFSVKKDWIEKAEEQAFEQGKSYSTVAIQFEPEGKNYFVIDENCFRMLQEVIEGV